MPQLTGNGQGDWVPVKGPFHYHVSGNFGGGTVQVQFLDVDGNTRVIAGSQATAAVDKLVNTGFNTDVRVDLSGATAPALDYNIKSLAP